MKEVLNRLALGRGYVLSRAEYIASTLLEMTPVIVTNPTVTLGVTRGLVLYVNGEWLLSDPEMQDDEVVGACLYHECEHPLRGMDRLEALPNKALANIAGDEAINYDLRLEKWRLPSWVVYPETFGHPNELTLEQYYELLSKQMAETNKQLQQFMDDCMRDQKASGGAGTQGQNWIPRVGSGSCGSVGGNPVDAQVEQELDAQYGKSRVEVDTIRRATLNDIEEYTSQHGRGSVPGRLQQLLKTRIKEPDVNWKKELKRLLRHSADVIISGAMDYSMRRPSIGGALVGVTSAGLIERQIQCLIVEDTSASMSDENIQQARNETYHLLRKLGLHTAWHMQCDTSVKEVRKIKLRHLPELHVEGRGGTNFIPVFEAAVKLRPRPNLLVFFTDGDGPAPKAPPPGMAVVWCIVRTPYARRPANWGNLIVCDKNQKLAPPY